MALSRSQKEELVADYGGRFSSAPHAFLISFSGITVPQVTDLRQRVREGGGHYEVVKNTLALRAVKGTPLEGLSEQFVGPTAVAYSEEDPVSLAKVLTTFAKDVPAIEFKGGLVEGQTVAAEDIKAIADLPSREELITKLVFLLQSPISRFVRGLGAIPQQFVSVLGQVARAKESS